jgi:hypothetical protein
MNTYQLNIIYPNTVSLHRITVLVESVQGTRIKNLKLICQGKDFVGSLEVETSDLIGFNTIIKLMRASRGLTSVVKR